MQVNCCAPYTVQMESETEKLGCCNATPTPPAIFERLCMRNFRMSSYETVSKLGEVELIVPVPIPPICSHRYVVGEW